MTNQDICSESSVSGRRGTRTPEPEWERIVECSRFELPLKPNLSVNIPVICYSLLCYYSPLQLPLCDPPKNYLLITYIWVMSGIRTHINMLHRHAPKPLGHHYHILKPHKDSNSNQQIRVLNMLIHYTIAVFERLVGFEPTMNYWFCRPMVSTTRPQAQFILTVCGFN